METSLTRKIGSLGEAVLSAAIIAGLLLFAGTTRAPADDHDCQKRVAKADHNLHEAIKHHGRESKQADHARHELQEAREHCWNTEHKWWDEDAKRWRTERDWDDHDHDRDWDHDHDHH